MSDALTSEYTLSNENEDYSYESSLSAAQQEKSPFPFKLHYKDEVVDEDSFNILDPDDPLMQRFQDALKAHLTRLDNKLADEIHDLENALKDANKSREDEALFLYEVQQESMRQESAIENYKDMLAEVVNARADLEERLKRIKENHKKVTDELNAKRSKEKKLQQTIESLDALQQQFSKWETELANSLTISQRISEKDKAMERELLYQKQQRDYVLYRLEDEVWRLQSEIKDLDEQLQIKDQERITLGQTIADANADLEGLEKEHKTLYAAWNSVLNLINQRDRIYEEIITEQSNIRGSLQSFETQISKLKKDSAKEMENNERLTTLQARINEEINNMKKLYESDRSKYLNLEMNFVKTSKLLEQNEKEFQAASVNYEMVLDDERTMNKDILKFTNEKRSLEDELMTKLDDKVSHDKTIKYCNKLLHEAKDANLEHELNLTRYENLYGKALLELEKFNSILENEKYDLNAMAQSNAEKQKEIEKLQADIKNYEMSCKQKERKISNINKKIEEIIEAAAGKEVNPLDAKISALEKNINETEKKVKEAQKFWLRQQSDIFSLSKQRDSQLRELNVMARDIIMMDQKNMKLEVELEKQKKEEANIGRTMNALQQKLMQINLRLATQKKFKNQLEDKNNVTKTEYMQSLEEAEIEIIKLQTDIKQLNSDKYVIRDELLLAQQESLSWEKKVQLAQETNKNYKEERGAGGDVSVMRSEIHKMEMRLSYLRKAQEKLVNDMEYCISRRDNIVDTAMAREKKNPKNLHNQKIVFRKRLDDQKTKIKQVTKDIKQVENKIEDTESEQKKLLEYLTEGQKLLRQNEDIIPDIEKQIVEAELVKHHNLEILVRKQRKVNMFRDIKNGCYKPLIKNEPLLTEEWQSQQEVNQKLNEVMKLTEHDFPLLKNQIRKILLTLEN